MMGMTARTGWTAACVLPLAIGCGVPDLSFSPVDASVADGARLDASAPVESGTAEASVPGTDGGSEDASPLDDGAPDAAPVACPGQPPEGGVCCGDVPCFGCSANQCSKCDGKCDAGEVCCAHGSGSVACRTGNACP